MKIQGINAPNSYPGIEGDIYVDTVTGDVYVKLGGTWLLQTRGPVGPIGAVGSPGVAGAPMGASNASWPWEETPRWHWRQLLGQKWRRYRPGHSDRHVNGYVHSKKYDYETTGQRARNILEETFNVGTEQSPPNRARGAQGTTRLFREAPRPGD